jgi:hypothetical protein
LGYSYYRCCWHEFSNPLFPRYTQTPINRRDCSLGKEFYIPKDFFIHAASLHQAFAHCGRFSTAASRRSKARVSVPSLGNTLSRPLPVIALVGRYLTNKLIGRRPLPNRFDLHRTLYPFGSHRELVRLSASYTRVRGKYLRITNSFAAICIATDRTTCMPSPRRQRSS